MSQLKICLLILLALPLTALSEPKDIAKYRFRGEGASFQLGTPPHPCVKITDRGYFNAAVMSTNKAPDAPTASFSMTVENICSNEYAVIHGYIAAPDLAMTVSGAGKTITLRGTMPITTENMLTGSRISEQITFDLVLTASSDGLRRRHGSEHIVNEQLRFRSMTTFDQREYTDVTAIGSFAGTVAGLPVGMGNIGNFLIQTEQDRTVQVQKF